MNGIAIIGLRILAVYQIVIGINAITGMSAVLTLLQPGFKESLSLLQILSVAIPFTSGIIIWLLSVPISKFVANSQNTDTINIDDVYLVTAGTFLIGVYIAFQQLPTLYFALVKYNEIEYGMESTSVIKAIKLSSVNLALGILLMVGHKFIVRAYKWLRRAG